MLPMTNLFQLTLFGSPEIRLNGQAVTGFRSSKAQALLYYLAATRRPHTRPTLAGLFWGDQPEAAARTSLSKCLSNLRDLVGDAVLVDRQTVAFNRHQPYHLDTEHFLAGIGQPPTPTTIPTWQAALALYRGDFLEGFYVRDAPDFEQWVLVQRAYYRETMVQGLHTLATLYEQQGNLPQAINYTRRLLSLEPWREEAHRQLMVQLARSGQRAAALTQFETCRRILEEELTVEPDAETVALVEAIREGKFDKVTGWQGDKVNAMPDRHPITVSPLHPVSSALPIPPTSLIGRGRELGELAELIGDPQCRLITISGPGGMGKTRLALAAAADQRVNFEQGAVFVPLAGVSSAQFLPQAILTALNVPLRDDLTPQQQLLATLAHQERLLLLDNYEQLLPAIELVVDLLHYAPGLTLLVTSRERLALQAEHLVELTGLAYPYRQSPQPKAQSWSAWTDYAAVQLFLQRVRQTQLRIVPTDEEMAAVVRICAMTEGMPLALELAAAMTRTQPLVTLASALAEGQTQWSSRLRDLPERHRTMTAVFDHSWQLLAAEEQQVLAALSVFRGGFDMTAAEQVASANVAILMALIDKSWLRCSPSGRYEIHELARQYASQHLFAFNEFDAVQKRYTDYFLQLSEVAQSTMEGPQQIEWMARIEQEIDNLRAVLKRLIQHAPQAGLRMTLNLFRLWQAGGHLQEGREWFALALAHPESISADVRANAYREVGFLTICMNKIEEAEELLAQSFAIYQKLDTTDRQVMEGLASVLNRQSLVPLFRGDYAHTLHLCHQGLAMARGIGSQWQASMALFFAGEAFYLQGLFTQSQSTYEESLRLCDAVGNLRSSGRRLVRLGHVACAQGELTQANSLFKKGLLVAAESHDRPGISFALVGLARAAALCGDYQRAAILTAAKEEVATTNPIAHYWPMDRIENECTLAILHAHLDDATFAAAWAEGIAMSVEQAVAYAVADPTSV